MSHPREYSYHLPFVLMIVKASFGKHSNGSPVYLYHF